MRNNHAVFIQRLLFFARRGIDHLRQMDFAHTPGRAGYVLYRLGVISAWKKHLVRRYEPAETRPLIHHLPRTAASPD